MIRINLIGSREGEESSSRRTEGIFAGVVLGLLLAGVAMAYLSQQSTVSNLEATAATLEADLVKIRQQDQEFKKMEQQKKETEDKLYIVGTLTSKERRAAPVHILDDLSSSAPEYLWLTDFTERGGTTQINGKAVDNQTIASFANDLAKSRYFQKVEIRETAQEDVTTASRPSALGGKQAPPQPQIPMKKFLIESMINYLPGTIQQTATSEASVAKGSGKGKEGN
jgi:Tfp pilus assembly protein PilN